AIPYGGLRDRAARGRSSEAPTDSGEPVRSDREVVGGRTLRCRGTSPRGCPGGSPRVKWHGLTDPGCLSPFRDPYLPAAAGAPECFRSPVGGDRGESLFSAVVPPWGLGRSESTGGPACRARGPGRGPAPAGAP